MTMTQLLMALGAVLVAPVLAITAAVVVALWTKSDRRLGRRGRR